MMKISVSLTCLPFILAGHHRVDPNLRHLNIEHRFSKSVKFGVFTDPQLGLLDSYVGYADLRDKWGLPKKQPGIKNNGSAFHNELDITNRAISYLNNRNLDFIVVLGDMVNQYPKGAMHSKLDQQTLDEWAIVNTQQVAALQTSFRKSKAPIFVVPGNHDVGNSFRQEALDKYKEQWGADYFYFENNEILYSPNPTNSRTAIRAIRALCVFLFAHFNNFCAVSNLI